RAARVAPRRRAPRARIFARHAREELRYGVRSNARGDRRSARVGRLRRDVATRRERRSRDARDRAREEGRALKGVVVLGGGVSGLAAAAALAEAGVRPVTVLEGGRGVGGLAGSFANDHGVFPLWYHHILERDRTLLFVLRALGLMERVRWRRVPLLF